ncbi:MAG: hypothetical protein IIA64_04610 [Planctomycetes bacterium]|nr:hypothetical protein [Planctomycetota bacterium]
MPYLLNWEIARQNVQKTHAARVSELVATDMIDIMDLIGIGFAIFLVVHIVIFVLRNYGRIRRKQERFAGRPVLPCDRIYQTYFPESGLDQIDVQHSWQELAKTLKLDPQRLRPTDRFDRELAPVVGTTKLDELHVLEAVLALRVRTRGLQAVDLETLETLEDYIRATSRRFGA